MQEITNKAVNTPLGPYTLYLHFTRAVLQCFGVVRVGWLHKGIHGKVECKYTFKKIAIDVLRRSLEKEPLASRRRLRPQFAFGLLDSWPAPFSNCLNNL